MTYLIDSDWLADYLKGRTDAVQLLSRLFSAGLAISIITYGEVYEGIYFGRERDHFEGEFRRFLRGVRVLPISRTTARRFALVRGTVAARPGSGLRSWTSST